MTKQVKTQIKKQTAWVRIDRPKQKNALSIQLLELLLKELASLDSNPKVRVIVIYGEEDFSSGGDINEMLVSNLSEASEIAQKVQNIYSDIEKISKPLIAYTKGLVFGGGFELALVCDLILSHSNSKFSLPEASLGIVPGGGATQRLKHFIGQQNAAYILMTGDVFSAEKMLSMNLIQEIVDDMDRIEFIINSISKKEPTAIKAIKNLLKKDLDFKSESETFANLVAGSGKKGIKSFIETKKLPKW